MNLKGFMSLKDKEEENFQLFKKMIKNLKPQHWEDWQLRPEANFFMTFEDRYLTENYPKKCTCPKCLKKKKVRSK